MSSNNQEHQQQKCTDTQQQQQQPLVEADICAINTSSHLTTGAAAAASRLLLNATANINNKSEELSPEKQLRKRRRRKREEEEAAAAAESAGEIDRVTMVPGAEQLDKNYNNSGGGGGGGHFATKIDLRIGGLMGHHHHFRHHRRDDDNDDDDSSTSYKPLINGSASTDSMVSMAAASAGMRKGSGGQGGTTVDELEMLAIMEDAHLLSVKGDGGVGTPTTTETPSPEPSVVLRGGAHESAEETACTIAWQVAIPFLIAGLGMVGAGLVLDIVQHWEVFRVVSEVFILVPALLGLKGNLEMTLASRLSTQANLGHMDTKSEMWKMIGGNLALIQCQAAVVGFLASMAAVIMGWIPDGVFEVKHALLLCASSLVTASVASFVLGAIMVGVVVLSRKVNINPDNVATPIAASLGDLTTLSLLAGISSALYNSLDEHVWLAPSVICLSLLLTPIWVMIAKRNPYTCKVLYSGWTPVIAAMGISSLGGLILDYTVSSFKGIAVFQPVINGVGGNLVAVHASRISTSLHQSSSLGRLPPHLDTLCINPCTSYFGKDPHARTSRVLMLLVVPGHLIFTYTIFYVKAGHTSLTPVFVLVYLLAAVLQVAILLYMARILIHWMWLREVDPDNEAIPYLTALGDLLGTTLLALAFHFLYLIGDKDSDVGD